MFCCVVPGGQNVDFQRYVLIECFLTKVQPHSTNTNFLNTGIFLKFEIKHQKSNDFSREKAYNT